jgi:membrane protein YqaA with SNARE-associated domain
MHEIIELLRSLTDPEKLRALLTTVLSGWWAYVGLSAIVFAETGLLIGFFLPGDSLLFTVGVVAGAGDLNVALIVGVLIVAAIVGDAVGFYLGRATGPAIFNRPDSTFFKQEYRQDDHLRALRAHYPHLRSVYRRRRQHVVRALSHVQRVRWHRLGGADDHVRLLPWQCAAYPAAF